MQKGSVSAEACVVLNASQRQAGEIKVYLTGRVPNIVVDFASASLSAALQLQVLWDCHAGCCAFPSKMLTLMLPKTFASSRRSEARP